MFADWDVEIFDIVPRPNSQKNPYTGLPIDPDGLTLSLFTMQLTHRPSGKILNRADLASQIDAAFLARYARAVIEVAEASQAVQKVTDAKGVVISESPLKGPLVITLPSPPAPSQAQQDLQNFQIADNDLAQTSTLVERLKVSDPSAAADLDKLVQQKQTVRDAAAAPVIDALKAAASTPVTP